VNGEDDTSSATAQRNRLTTALGQVAKQDRAALRQVYDMTSAKLFGVCLRISADRDEAEDILQDVYLKIWNRAGRFDPARASPITWLCTIARNTAIDLRRSSRHPGMLPEEAAHDLADPARSADGLLEDMESRVRIFECLDVLDSSQSSSIRAAFFDGLTYAQLAARMDVPLGTMKSWIRRGMQKLKECIGDG
jgi:RNA polymerase sigma-70 factor (ECF subfamily)